MGTEEGDIAVFSVAELSMAVANHILIPIGKLSVPHRLDSMR